MSHRCADEESPESDPKMDISGTPTEGASSTLNSSAIPSPAEDDAGTTIAHHQPSPSPSAAAIAAARTEETDAALDNRHTADITQTTNTHEQPQSPTGQLPVATSTTKCTATTATATSTPTTIPTPRTATTTATAHSPGLGRLNTSLSAFTLSTDSHPLMSFHANDDDADDDDADDAEQSLLNNRNRSNSAKQPNSDEEDLSSADHPDNRPEAQRPNRLRHMSGVGAVPLRLGQPRAGAPAATTCSSSSTGYCGGARPKTKTTRTYADNQEMDNRAAVSASASASAPPHSVQSSGGDSGDPATTPVATTPLLHQPSQQRRIAIDAALLSDDDEDCSSIGTISPQRSFDFDDESDAIGDGDEAADGSGRAGDGSISSSVLASVAREMRAAELREGAGSGLQVPREAAGGAAAGSAGGVSPIPQYAAAEEARDTRNWKRVQLPNGESREIDMRVIEPFQRVLSHGGYLSTGGQNAIVVFTACHLPDKGRRDYQYVMNNLFLYVVKTLEQLITDDYVLVYMHGGASRHNAPQFSWLKSCYQLLDRRLRKSLKTLYIVHPSLWLKSMVVFLRPFTSRKFWRKVVYVKSLEELYQLVPLQKACISEKVRRYDDKHA